MAEPTISTERVRQEQLLSTQQALSEQTRILQAVSRNGLALASQSDIDAILRSVTDSATELMGAQFGAFLHREPASEQRESFTLRTVAGGSREDLEHVDLRRAAERFGPALRGEATVRADDISEHSSDGKAAACLPMPRGSGPARSCLAVPVVSRGGEVIGALLFAHSRAGFFTERHEAAVGIMAAQAAVAIDNARLLEVARKAQQQLAHLNETLEARVAERSAALSRTEQQLQQLVSGVTDCAIFMLERNGQVASWNPGAERIKGYTAEEIIGRHFRIFYTEEDRARGAPEQALEIAAREGKYEAETWRLRKDGTRFWASVLIDPIRDGSGEVVCFAKITRDMTERRAMQEQLHQAQKMEAIGQLTGGVAHDFNNLLTVILGNLETLQRQLPAEQTRLHQAVDQASRGARRAAALTSQLLAFARRQPLNPKPTDVNRLVARMSDLIRSTLGEKISLETALAAGLWRTEIDPHQLESALLNLAVNARDAMPAGGKLTIVTTNTDLDEQYASRYAEISAGQYVLICVSDTGTGMTSDVMASAFDPFFTTKPIGEGTGLGLSQVFGFVKQSCGHVNLYSEPGQGTTIKIYLPRLAGVDPPDEPTSEAVEPHGDAGETILAVEDQDDVRAYSTQSLRELGYSVLQAGDGASALDIIERHPEITLLFTDVGMAGMSGPQLADEARRRRPGLRVLYTSGYARNAIVHQGRVDAGVELLTKPFTRLQLAVRVRHILDGKPESPPPGRRVAVLVEDEALVRLFVAQTLEQAGFDVVQTATAHEALGSAEQLKTAELAIVDIGLPDRSGLELAEELRARWPNMKVALASGYGEQVLGELHGDPCVTFLSKPFDEPSILAALSKLGFTTDAPDPG